MFRQSLAFCSIFLLASCSYAMDKSIQKIDFATPGARDAVCYAYVEGLRYKVRPPQSITINNTGEDLVVDCLAPGNRRRKVFIEAVLSDHAMLNAATGVVPGVAWDYASGALYKYPDTVTIDFTSADATLESLPAHNNPDVKQPEEYKLEEFKPGLPRLNSDNDARPTVLKKRGQFSEAIEGSYTESPIVPAPVPVSDKGDLKRVIEENTAPAAKPSGLMTAPAPLYPGQ